VEKENVLITQTCTEMVPLIGITVMFFHESSGFIITENVSETGYIFWCGYHLYFWNKTQKPLGDTFRLELEKCLLSLLFLKWNMKTTNRFVQLGTRELLIDYHLYFTKKREKHKIFVYIGFRICTIC
jgi:hypothetical protein